MYLKITGKIKEVAGKLTDNPKLEAEGAVEKMIGKVQEKIGQVKEVWGINESVVSCTGVSLCPGLRLHDAHYNRDSERHEVFGVKALNSISCSY